MAHTVFICSTCAEIGGDPKGVALIEDVRARLASFGDFEVRAQACLNVCDKPTALAFRAEGKAAYLFAGVDAEADAADVEAFAKLYAESPDGWIEDARSAGRLRFCLIGRIPA
jgi:predicted metal-binding protein